jgi:hypothetical protein
MIEDQITQEENKSLDIDTLIIRAKLAEENKKFQIAANHYFTILSRHFVPLNLNPDLLKTVLDNFVYNIILFPAGIQRDRLLNFLLKNENLNVYSYKPFLEKM